MTGMLARNIYRKEKSVITMKFIQTGCNYIISEDIMIHRKIMNIPLLEEDKKRLTCPYVLKYPSSPHLAAKLEGEKIRISKIDRCINQLTKKYKNIIIEGAGGIYVPLTEEITLLDWLKKERIPVIVVTTPRLGSINHTLLTIETLLQNNIPIKKIIYNTFFKEDDTICNDTFYFLKKRYENIKIRAIQALE